MAALAVLLAAAGVELSAWLYALEQRGRQAEAAALSTDGEIVVLSTTRGDRPRWVANYSYRVEGRTYEGSSRLGRQDRESYRLGDPLPIRYLSAEPGISWVEGRQPARPPILLAPLAFVGLGTLAAVLGLTIRRQRWLLADGRPAVAVVTSTRRISAGHALSHRTTLEFQTLSGARATARLDLQKRAPVGSELVVLYDAESPARCRPYPLSLVRLARL